MKTKLKRYLTTFGLFLGMIAVWGTFIAICNHYFRTTGQMSNWIFGLLAAACIGGFYLCYRWLAKRIDALEKKEQNTDNHVY